MGFVHIYRSSIDSALVLHSCVYDLSLKDCAHAERKKKEKSHRKTNVACYCAHKLHENNLTMFTLMTQSKRDPRAWTANKVRHDEKHAREVDVYILHEHRTCSLFAYDKCSRRKSYIRLLSRAHCRSDRLPRYGREKKKRGPLGEIISMSFYTHARI